MFNFDAFVILFLLVEFGTFLFAFLKHDRGMLVVVKFFLIFDNLASVFLLILHLDVLLDELKLEGSLFYNFPFVCILAMDGCSLLF